MDVLKPEQFNRIGSLTEGLRDQGMALSVLAGVRPGVVAVDNVDVPTALFIGAPEGGFAWTYLVGAAEDPAFRRDLSRWLFDERGLGDEVSFSFLVCDRAAWEEALEDVIAPRTVIPDRRLHYETTARPGAWHARVPDGYEIVDLDRRLLESDVELHPQVAQWLDANFGSADGFLEHGLGAVAVHGREIVGWILADSFVDALCDIGGEVAEAHRRKGLACASTCRAVELALDRGAERIGWHCHAINAPSIKTAEAAGFTFVGEYTIYPIQFDPEKHEKLVGIVVGEYVEAGDAGIASGDYEAANESFSRALRLQPEAPVDRLHTAARAAAGVGEAERALDLLTQAVEAGWSQRSSTETQPEFASLHQDPRWAQILNTMSGAA